MSRRTGNNYSGPRWLYSTKRKPTATDAGGKSWSGSSRNRPGAPRAVEHLGTDALAAETARSDPENPGAPSKEGGTR